MNLRLLLLTALLSAHALQAQSPAPAPPPLPSTASTQLLASLKLASHFQANIWRDTEPLAGDLISAYIEIPLGGRTKYEFDIGANTRKIDRIMPDSVDGYPVNYGFVPQTISYDGDPFDALVLGPALPGGELVRGKIVGLMMMEDEKGLDPKVVLSPVDAEGNPIYALTPADQDRIAAYFRGYKAADNDPATWSTVSDWGSAGDGRAYVLTTYGFFRQCRVHTDRQCQVVT